MKSSNSSENFPVGNCGAASSTTCLICANMLCQFLYGNLPIAISICSHNKHISLRLTGQQLENYSRDTQSRILYQKPWVCVMLSCSSFSCTRLLHQTECNSVWCNCTHMTKIDWSAVFQFTSSIIVIDSHVSCESYFCTGNLHKLAILTLQITVWTDQ